ncbi:MAG: SDR family NAD(P)-dependent oxidoreductase [Capsulimonadaceae bacterium]
MLKESSEAIVNCSSTGGIVGSPGRSAYAASEHAIMGLMLAWRTGLWRIKASRGNSHPWLFPVPRPIRLPSTV